jgi:hypothetical protein
MNKARNYCTYFDSNYLTRGLITYHTLREHSSREITLWVLCLDDKVYDFLKDSNFSGIKPIRLNELEEGDKSLAGVKQTRSRAEYYFTCTPCLAKFVLDQNPEISDITYIDSDLCFFNDPELIYSEIGENSIAITPHRFAKRNKECEKWGIYNVAFNYFRRDEDGLKCLNWWRERCLEWCYDRLEDGKFADQKYLDNWPSEFKNVKVLDNPGINLAIWNVEDIDFSFKNKKLFVNKLPLIFYHFHGFKRVSKNVFTPSFEHYKVKPNNILISKIYQFYACSYLALDLSPNSGQYFLKHPRESLPVIPSWIKEATRKNLMLYAIQGRIIYCPDKMILVKVYRFLISFIRYFKNQILLKKYLEFEY